MPAFRLVCAMLVLLTARPGAAAASRSQLPASRTDHGTVRVGLWTLWHDRQLTLAPAASGGNVSLQTCAACATLSFTRQAEVRAEGDRVKLTAASKTGYARELRITGGVLLTAHGESVRLQNPVTIAARRGELVLAVTLPVESYVERVVASESGAADSEESLKALAIVVRSFALHEAHGHPEFDVCDSTHCQLLHWAGNGPRQAAAHAATLATAGQTLWFNGRPAPAYFGKDCGGRSASLAEIWPHAQQQPYLASRPDRYCSGGGSQTWASEFSRADLAAALAAAGVARPGWRSLTVVRRGDSGRAVMLKLDATEISAEAFRLAVGQALGWNRIPSTWFEVSQQGERLQFHGRGWGNGVGLCQKGAAAMAAQHQTAAQILEQYFPGAQAADESTGRAWQTFAGDGFTLETLRADDAAFLPVVARARADAAQRSGLAASTRITIRSFSSTPAFRAATLAPGWVAAFTEGAWIGTQPLPTLAARHLLEPTMRHEFLHVLVEHEAGSRAPLWLREGLVEAWSEPTMPSPDAAPAMRIDAIDAALAHAATERESFAAHQAAGVYAARLLARYGRERTLAWLRTGLPTEVATALRQR